MSIEYIPSGCRDAPSYYYCSQWRKAPLAEKDFLLISVLIFTWNQLVYQLFYTRLHLSQYNLKTPHTAVVFSIIF